MPTEAPQNRETHLSAKPRTWRFQFALTDAVAVGLLMKVAAALWRLANPLWWIRSIAVGHFFLFCKVFRIIRRREMIMFTRRDAFHDR